MIERAVIQKVSTSKTQSGKAVSKPWVLRFPRSLPPYRDSLTGWASGRETVSQVKLFFNSCESAVAYAKSKKLSYVVQISTESEVVVQNYSSNFSFTRNKSWTH